MSKKRRFMVFALVCALVGPALLAACGGDDPTDAASTPEGGWAPFVKTPDANGLITVVARDLAFDVDTIEASPGVLTIRFDNQDTATPHNLHVFAGSDARGESVGGAPVDNGWSQHTFGIDVTTGMYYFQCDVHPNMHGVLTVR